MMMIKMTNKDAEILSVCIFIFLEESVAKGQYSMRITNFLSPGKRSNVDYQIQWKKSQLMLKIMVRRTWLQ